MAKRPSAQDRLADAAEHANYLTERASREGEHLRRERDATIEAERVAALRPLRQMSFARMVKGVPQVLAEFKVVVPAKYVAPEDHQATVECPCGERPVVAAQTPTGCACGRYYLYVVGSTSREVRVAWTPT